MLLTDFTSRLRVILLFKNNMKRQYFAKYFAVLLLVVGVLFSTLALPAVVSADARTNAIAQVELNRLGDQLHVIQLQGAAIESSNATIQAQANYIGSRLQAIKFQNDLMGGNPVIQAQLDVANGRLQAVRAESARLTNIGRLYFALGLLQIEVRVLQVQKTLL